jgi:hypothetical protein
MIVSGRTAYFKNYDKNYRELLSKIYDFLLND